MKIFYLFNMSRKSAIDKSDYLSAGDTPQNAVGAFITPQSLMSFPVASGFVTGIWKIEKNILPNTIDSNIALLIISFCIGFFIWGISVSDPELKLTKRDKWISFGIAIINSLYLAMSALGIEYTISG